MTETFNNFQLSPALLKAIAESGYTKPTSIQNEAIPFILEEKDVFACAQTGTGKTAAFAIPILEVLQRKAQADKHIKALILTPTRELAQQISEKFSDYGRHLTLKHMCIFGGVSQNAQVQNLQKGVDILIATPGRLLDLVQQGFIQLKHISIFVLDEADRMLDMGFERDVKKIQAMIPTKRQTLLFSATMPEKIMALAHNLLYRPEYIDATPNTKAADSVTQEVIFIDKSDKTKLLLKLIENKIITKAIVFTRTKHGADKLVKRLDKTGVFALAIHGNKSQNHRQKSLSDFKQNKVNILVATDIAARGIDIEALPQVVNYEMPDCAETYVHRIGRTGRAGVVGRAISFCDPEEQGDLHNIQKLIGYKLPGIQGATLNF